MQKNEWKNEITKNEYLQLEGLMSVAHRAANLSNECEALMAEIIDYESDFGGAHLLGDEIWEDRPNVRRVLKLMGIKVKK